VGAAVQRGLHEHDVVVATSGTEALELIRRGDRFDHVLCDIHMAGIDGREFHARLTEERPDLEPRLTFMTGGTFTEGADAFLASVKDRCLLKPVSIETLRRWMDGGLPRPRAAPPG
jgi:CheY-like chemotaxis protein